VLVLTRIDMLKNAPFLLYFCIFLVQCEEDCYNEAEV